jgi:alanine racemase
MSKLPNGISANRRQFLAGSAAALALPTLAHGEAPAAGREFRLRPGGHATGFDPWIEVLAEAFRHNVREVSRMAGGTPLLAVIKNNAYGLGDQVVGPIVAACPEVAGLACTRVSEALALRGAGVRKPILNMAETSEEEIAELVRHDVWPSVWLDDAHDRLARVAKRLRKRVAVHAFIDTGMNREGMPDYRAHAWLEALCRDKATLVAGTYMMFNHDLEADREQYARFQRFTTEARQAGLALGRLHGSPSFEVLHLPEARFDLVRPGNLLFGNVGTPPEGTSPPDLRPVFRLCARVARLEQLRPGESASFARGGYVAKVPTWIAMLPIGHTDGYPATAANTCSVLIRGRLFPVVSVVASAHVILEIGAEKAIELGDVATLIGPDDPAITSHAVAEKTGVGFYPLITKLSPFLPKRVV